MSKATSFTLIILLIINILLFYPTPIYALGCDLLEVIPNRLIQNQSPLVSGGKIEFKVRVTDKTVRYNLVFDRAGVTHGNIAERNLIPDSDGLLYYGNPANKILPSLAVDPTDRIFQPGTHLFDIEKDLNNNANNKCGEGFYTVISDFTGGIKDCKLEFDPATPNETQDITLKGIIESGSVKRTQYKLLLTGPQNRDFNLSTDINGSITPINIPRLLPGNYNAVLYALKLISSGRTASFVEEPTNCKYTLNVAIAGQNGSVSQVGVAGPAGQPTTLPAGPSSKSGGEVKPGCTDDVTNPGISTAIGCIHTNPQEFVKDFMNFSIGIGGGLAFLMMLLGAFQMLTSAGNPDALKAGQDRLTSAVIGLLFVIFAVLLIQIIGLDILRIPGFS